MGFEVVMAKEIRPWQGCNLKIVLHSMLPKLLGAEATKSTRLILCSALCLCSADYGELGPWRLTSACCSSFSLQSWKWAEPMGRQDTKGRGGEGEDYPEGGRVIRVIPVSEGWGVRG